MVADLINVSFYGVASKMVIFLVKLLFLQP